MFLFPHSTATQNCTKNKFQILLIIKIQHTMAKLVLFSGVLFVLTALAKSFKIEEKNKQNNPRATNVQVAVNVNMISARENQENSNTSVGDALPILPNGWNPNKLCHGIGAAPSFKNFLQNFGDESQFWWILGILISTSKFWKSLVTRVRPYWDQFWKIVTFEFWWNHKVMINHRGGILIFGQILSKLKILDFRVKDLKFCDFVKFWILGP